MLKNCVNFVIYQISLLRKTGPKVLPQKIKKLQIAVLISPFYVLLYIVLFHFILITRLIKPWIIVRVERLNSVSFGHFSANTELYLCEQKAGVNQDKKNIDLFYLDEFVCNKQLVNIWKRYLTILPRWIMRPADQINKLIYDSKSHQINATVNHDRDIYGLIDKYKATIKFTDEEKKVGLAQLQAMGVPPNAAFVCLAVRDSAYKEGENFNYHSYRDDDIGNFLFSAEALTKMGYYVVRMGAKVEYKMISDNTKIIDYSCNGMRSEFMDIYLGAKCSFAISSNSGWDSIPKIFRRPIVYVNAAPVGYLSTSSSKHLLLCKRHLSKASSNQLTLREILSSGIGYYLRAEHYKNAEIELISNTPEEIHDVVMEMVERIRGTWLESARDTELQERFQNIFSAHSENLVKDQSKPMHGEIRARHGAKFLRDNPSWLD
jgi:putative glycosyltransferase (TIGR04372 family)